MNIFAKMTTFITEVRSELRKVVWPTKPQAIKLTTVVLVVCAALATYLGLLDFILTESLKSFVKK